VYESQRLTRVSRIHRRVDQLNGSVIEGEGGWRYKPRGMHWRTFHRICDEADTLDQHLNALFVQQVMQRLPG
jgi:hypothetical protein